MWLLNSDGSFDCIAGFNADEDPTTRTPELDSEPALCVPSLAHACCRLCAPRAP